MTFLHTTLAFAGLACVAIPIIIHLLFRRRRKPVMWGAMRFLVEAFKKQRRRLRLEQFLLLLARCLALACLAAALGRPALEAAGILGAGSGRTLYLLLDTSLASAARDSGGAADTDQSALERHKKKAVALLDALGPSDRAALITLGAPADSRVLPPSSDLAAIRSLIERATPTDAAADWPGAFRAISGDLERPAQGSSAFAAAPLVVTLSDFTLGSADTTVPLPRISPANQPASSRPRLIASRPHPSPPGNVQVLAVEPLRSLILTGADTGALAPGASGAASAEPLVVRVPLRRTGPAVSEPATTTVRVSLAPDAGVAAAARATVRWSAGQSEAVATVQLDTPLIAGAGERAIVAEIDQDALPGDNVSRKPLALRESLKVGLVDRRRFTTGMRADRMSAGEWVRLALRPFAPAGAGGSGSGGGGSIEIVDIEPVSLDAASLASLDAAVIARPDLLEDDAWTRLRRFADAGGLVLVLPPAEPNVHIWTDAFVRHMGLGWRIAREPRVFTTPQGLADEQPEAPLLALVKNELPDLLKPVSIDRTLPLEETSPATRALLNLKDGSPWLVAAAPGSGETRTTSSGAEPAPTTDAQSGLVLYLASAPELAWTDLPAKPLMVPLLHELTRQGAGQAAGAWTQTAGAIARAPRRAVSLVDLTTPAADRAKLTVTDIGRTTEPVRTAALFRAIDDRGAERGLVAINADTTAGRTDPQPASAVSAWLGRSLGVEPGTDANADDETDTAAASGAVTWLDDLNPAAIFQAQRAESALSFPLLIAALAFLLIETFLSRIFSHATVGTQSAAPHSTPVGHAGPASAAA